MHASFHPTGAVATPASCISNSFSDLPVEFGEKMHEDDDACGYDVINIPPAKTPKVAKVSFVGTG